MGPSPAETPQLGREVDLDEWLPDPQVRTIHRRQARADADELWHAAEQIQVRQAPTLGRVLRWRIPGTPADLPYRDVFRRYPFTVLAEGDRWTVSGLCGRVWTLARDYPRIEGPQEFLDWDRPGTVRVVFAHWIEPGTDGRSALVSESRVDPVDRRAGLRLRAVWAVLGRFERLIGGEALRAATARAERGDTA
jgi:hypothetical protein